MTSDLTPFVRMNPVEQYMTQEKMAEQDLKKNILKIGIPKETMFDETRVPLVPESVGMLIQQGHTVLLEKEAGLGAGFPDLDYADNGATICHEAAEIFKSDVVLKVTPPTSSEIESMEARRILISALNYCGRDKEYFNLLIKKKITAISYETIRDKSGRFPIMQSISEIVGKGSILIASSLLSDPVYGKGVMLGGFPGITPAEVVIIGAGTVSASAARTAAQLGAIVKVFDNNIYKLRSLTAELGFPVFTSIIQPKVLQKALRSADVVIGALLADEGQIPYIVPEDMVKTMKHGAVIVDISIDQGGGFETSKQTTHKDPVFVQHGVAHYCVPNVASRYARTSSYALSNYFTPLLSKLGDFCNLNQFILNEPGLLEAIYIYQGILTHPGASKRFNIPGQDINLLLAAF
ncbi:MAG: alanine dehydrogenase [Bacteroidales bacterium]